MKVAIVGSRTLDNEKEILKLIDKIVEENNLDIKEIVSGGDKGVDSIAETWAANNKVATTVFEADWNNLEHPDAEIAENKWGKLYNRRAGFIRNTDIAEYCDIGIAITTGSGGTEDTIKKIQKLNKNVIVAKIDDGDIYSYEF